MTAWINLFVCASFVCMRAPPISGDKIDHPTHAKCMLAAKQHAAKLRLGRKWEAECVEREVGK